MTRTEAHQILSRVREGADFTPAEITVALYATGDVDNIFEALAMVRRPEPVQEAA